VSDHDTPGQNGIEFLRTVREEYPDLPFVLFTGKGSEEVASDALSAGATDYFRKEADRYTVLANRILNAVESYRSQRAAIERNRKLRRYERMVNTMQEAACIYDADGRFEIVNEYLADWYGTTREELEGTQSNLVSHIRSQGETDRYEEMLDGNRSEIHGELADEFSGHGYAVIEYRLTPLTVDGTVESAVGIARDITEHREREQELQRQNERLEEFASVVSHDLRNPLNTAQGRLKLAQEECNSEHLDPIERANERMETLIDELLTLARQGDRITEPEPADLPTVVDPCWTTIETGDATLVTAVDRTIRADRSRLKQVFENLFRNAIEHGGRGVTVTVGELDDGFYVEDDGPGIPAGERDDVFQPGYSTSDQGTGFGLSIIKRVVEAHGWEITVAEGSDDGARFEITGVEFTAT
jgi:PAS domain S-box-containing protein